MRVYIDVIEQYPVYIAKDASEADQVPYEVDAEVLARWDAAEEAWGQTQAEIRNLIDPPCSECGDRTSRHQRWSDGRWGCLTCKKCQYGIPDDKEKD